MVEAETVFNLEVLEVLVEDLLEDHRLVQEIPLRFHLVKAILEGKEVIQVRHMAAGEEEVLPKLVLPVQVQLQVKEEMVAHP